ncbi:Acid alpha-amylase protein [Rutstroemia sp. NJR-2017a BBW]|nr:Acid alpha-amylase protein [Rutstroemia sp. NJR-2017a BBW]
MGFDAIWISPHGYWPEDFYSVNPHFGTSQDLLALSDALHARGMFLMIDYDDEKDCEEGWLGDGHVPLPDLDTENPTVVQTLQAWISAVVKRFKIDGLRVDTVKHVRKSFWPGFVRSAGVWCMGEVLSGDPDFLSSYQPYIGGLLDYGTYYPLKRAFSDGKGNMFELANLLTPGYRSKFRDVQQLATFMENHDMPRFTHDTSSDIAVVKNAMAWTLLTDGVPIIYYGQEQSFSGDGDPGSRELMWMSRYTTTPLYEYIALLNHVRRVSWDAGFGSHLAVVLDVDYNVVIIQKGPVLLVLSNQGSHSKPRSISGQTKFARGTVLVDVLTGQSVLVGRSAKITITAGQPRVFLPHKLATLICSDIAPPLQSFIPRLFSLFNFMSSSKSSSHEAERNFWPCGDAVNAQDIVLDDGDFASKKEQSGQILRPSPASIPSAYSIF